MLSARAGLAAPFQRAELLRRPPDYADMRSNPNRGTPKRSAAICIRRLESHRSQGGSARRLWLGRPPPHWLPYAHGTHSLERRAYLPGFQSTLGHASALRSVRRRPGGRQRLPLNGLLMLPSLVSLTANSARSAAAVAAVWPTIMSTTPYSIASAALIQ